MASSITSSNAIQDGIEAKSKLQQRQRSKSASVTDLRPKDIVRKYEKRRNTQAVGPRIRFQEGHENQIYSDDEIRASDYELSTSRDQMYRRKKIKARVDYETANNDSGDAKKKTLPRTLRLAFNKSVGNLRGLWVDMADHWKSKSGRDSQEMQRRSTSLSLLVVTWNMNGHVPDTDLSPLFSYKGDLQQGNAEHYHIIVVGTQECARSIEQSVLLPSKEEWENQLKTHLCADYELYLTETMTAIHLAVFIHKTIKKFASGGKTSKVATGLGNVIGNKGGIGACLKLGQHSILFINSHLTAHQQAVLARNHDYNKINEELGLYGYNPEDAHKTFVTDRFDYVFWFGDLNYRVNGTRRMVDALIERHEMDVLLGNDQLTLERKKGAVFYDFSEHSISFMPTYKVDFQKKVVGKKVRVSAARKKQENPSSKSEESSPLELLSATLTKSHVYDTSHKARVPAWTDRILFKAKECNAIPSEAVALTSAMAEKKSYTKNYKLLSSIFPEEAISPKRSNTFSLPPLPKPLESTADQSGSKSAPRNNDVVLSVVDNSGTSAELKDPIPTSSESLSDSLDKQETKPSLWKEILLLLTFTSNKAITPIEESRSINQAQSDSMVTMPMENAQSINGSQKSLSIDSCEESTTLDESAFKSFNLSSSTSNTTSSTSLPNPATINLPDANNSFASRKHLINTNAKKPNVGSSFSKTSLTAQQFNSSSSNNTSSLHKKTAFKAQSKSPSQRSTPLEQPNAKSTKGHVISSKMRTSGISSSANKKMPNTKHLLRPPLDPMKQKNQQYRNLQAIKNLCYDSVPNLHFSDHLPVVGVFSLPEVVIEALEVQLEHNTIRHSKIKKFLYKIFFIKI